MAEQVDDDGSFSLTLDEFQDAMFELGYSGHSDIPVAIFNQLDNDGSGKVTFHELNNWAMGRKLNDERMR